MTVDERYKLYYEYRYLIDNIIRKYPTDTYDIEELYDAGIAGLFKAIDDMQKDNVNIEFKIFALFCIKTEMNKRIDIKN